MPTFSPRVLAMYPEARFIYTGGNPYKPTASDARTFATAAAGAVAAIAAAPVVAGAVGLGFKALSPSPTPRASSSLPTGPGGFSSITPAQRQALQRRANSLYAELRSVLQQLRS